ncbi:DUF6668 family protein [Nocardia suismassiliense]|uniref:DUF6668 family protein n=1 Tax=Nocardia suismassiliense TaxID=2077092 RepID=UPI000D1EBC6C|nr:DUF6668 family protein [Nocardia suismassiliense]
MVAPIARGTSTAGPTTPAGLKVPAPEEQAPVWDRALSTASPPPAIWLLGAHGGAGVSTLARTWAPAADSQRGWPAADRYPNVVVLTRTHRIGLTAAHVLLRQAAAGLIGGCTLLGLVSVADHDGHLPATLRRQLELVEELAPASWRVPFLSIYRRLSVEQMPRWSPREESTETQRRFARTDPAATVHPDLVDIGRAVFDSARTAAISRKQR